SGAAASPSFRITGFTHVSTGNLPLPDGTQTGASVACPVGTVVLGGSVFVFSPSLLVNVNSSFPSRNGWAADVNNHSGSAASFEITAICANQPKHYSIIQSSMVSNPSGTQATASATCPSGSKPLSGGAFSSSGDAFVNMNSTFPLRHT